MSVALSIPPARCPAAGWAGKTVQPYPARRNAAVPANKTAVYRLTAPRVRVFGRECRREKGTQPIHCLRKPHNCDPQNLRLVQGNQIVSFKRMWLADHPARRPAAGWGRRMGRRNVPPTMGRQAFSTFCPVGRLILSMAEWIAMRLKPTRAPSGACGLL